tara:strand:- start:149 stop:427 length:279 start_codon:yes stop_codon:yes gene_type:complete
MAKRIADMTPREHALSLHRQLIAWAEGADAQLGNPYHIVNSHGEPWSYATSFLDYASSEAMGAFTVGTDEAVLFILFTAAMLRTWEGDHAPS